MSSVNSDMQNRDLQRLSEAAWRRRLTVEEQARLRQYLASHPEAKGSWEDDLALTRALNRLPAVTVSSNFTALVMQAARKAPVRQVWWRQIDLADWFPAGWRPRLALGTAMVCLSLLTIREYQTFQQQRQRMARDLASIGSLASNLPVDSLKNFDTIKRLSQIQVADEELLRVLR